jgi:hypothetical protein
MQILKTNENNRSSSEHMGTWCGKVQHKIKGLQIYIKYAFLIIFLHSALQGTELTQVLVLF